MKRLQTSLRRTTTDERLSTLAILYVQNQEDVIDIDGVTTDFAGLKGAHLARLVLDGPTLLPSLP